MSVQTHSNSNNNNNNLTGMSSTQVRSIDATLDHIRLPFQPRFDPRKKLADEIASSKRKIWDCIDPMDRQRYLEKKKYYKTTKSGGTTAAVLSVLGNEENQQQQVLNINDELTDSRRLSDTMKISKNSPFKKGGDDSFPTTTHSSNHSKTTTNDSAPAKRTDVEFKVNAMKVVELKRELKKLGCETGGLKKDLRARLLKVMMTDLDEETKKKKDQQQQAVIDNKVPGLPVVESSSFNNPVVSIEEAKIKDDSVGNEVIKQDMKAEVFTESQSGNAGSRLNEESQVKVNPRESVSSMDVEVEQNTTESESESIKPKNASGADSTKSAQLVPVASAHVEDHGHSGQSIDTAAGPSSSSNHGISNGTNGRHDTDSKEDKLASDVIKSPQAFDISNSKSANTAVVSSGGPGELPTIPSSTAAATRMSDSVDVATDADRMSVESIAEKKEIKENGSDVSAPLSEVSAGSISSGKSVKDMVSKFSTFSNMSNGSSISGSALSKGLKAKMDARLARNAEIREKSKPIKSATKVGLLSKECNSTLPLFASTTVPGSTKKQTLTAQMREKAAAASALKNGSKLMSGPSSALGAAKSSILSVSSASKPVLGSAQKKQPVWSHQNHGMQQDPLSATLKKGAQAGLASWSKPKVHSSPLDTYEISDREDSETDDSDSEAENSKPKKKIPVWATRANLMTALEQQYNGKGQNGQKIDPDDIFPEVQSCDLEAIFGNKKSKYRTRNSSGNWTRDKVTAAEKLVYKRDMGFPTKKIEESEV